MRGPLLTTRRFLSALADAPPAGTFVPRAAFPQPGNLVSSYFLGHHQTAITEMKSLTNSMDLILECRDYRVPLSSRNPLFEARLQGKERIIVYTKCDLATDTLDQKTRSTIRAWHVPARVLFSSTASRADVRKIVTYAKYTAKKVDKLTGCRVLIVGMPNVGKSSLVNSLRRVGLPDSFSKPAQTGAQPGVTRKMSSTIKISEEPLVYVIDSPGVFMPYLGHAPTMLKLALVGSVKDGLVPYIMLADYLLYEINRSSQWSVYGKWSQPTNEVMPLLEAIAMQTGKLKKGGERDLEAAAIWWIQQWRRGKMGKFLLDEVKKGGLKQWVMEQEEVEESESAARRRQKLARVAKAKVKKVKGGVQE